MVSGTVLGAGDKAGKQSLHSSRKRQTKTQGSTGDTGWLLNLSIPPGLLALPTSLFLFMFPQQSMMYVGGLKGPVM